ncbi:MAG: hypothetical protein ABIS29_16245 [Vicinamibacterales bacterium]
MSVGQVLAHGHPDRRELQRSADRLAERYQSLELFSAVLRVTRLSAVSAEIRNRS